MRLMGRRAGAETGLTLVELMISITIGLLLSAAFTSCWLGLLAHHQQQQRLNRLADEAMLLSGYISRELRRAGYWQGGVALLEQPLANPFADMAVEQQGTCLSYRYDLNGDGRLQGGEPVTAPWHAPATSSASNENFAMRVRDGAIQVSRDGGDCRSGGWESLSQPAVAVAPLTDHPVFALVWPSPSEPSGWRLVQPRISVSLLLQDRAEPELQRTLRFTVGVRNGMWRHE